MKSHFIIFEVDAVDGKTVDGAKAVRIGDGFAESRIEAKSKAMAKLVEEPKFDKDSVFVYVEPCSGCMICDPKRVEF